MSSKPNATEFSVNRDLCALCKVAGDLILCDLCPRSYHEDCFKSVLVTLAKGDPSGECKRQKRISASQAKDEWICPRCLVQDKMEEPVKDAISFSLAVQTKRSAGSGIPIAHVLQYLELATDAATFNQAFDLVWRLLRGQPMEIKPGSNLTLQVVAMMKNLGEIVNHDLLLNALKSCDDYALASGLGRMGGPQSCPRIGCPAHKGFRVLRTRCYYCGVHIMDDLTKLPIGQFDEFKPGPLRRELKFRDCDLEKERLLVATRGLEYFTQVAQEPKVIGLGDVIFLAYKLWGALRGSELETKARETVELLCNYFVDNVTATLSDDEDMPDMLDKTEGLHILTRILARSNHDSGQPKLNQYEKAQKLVDDLKATLRAKFLEFDITDLTGFDPTSLIPPKTPSNHCSNCGTQNTKRNATGLLCHGCKHTLQTKFDYGSMTDAVVWCFVFDSMSLEVECQRKGRRCALEAKDVLRMLPEARKYRELDELGEDFWKLECYFVTHFIYVMSDWGEVQLRRELYTEEFQFIASSLNFALQLDDPEIVGEFVHCLHILGYNENDEATNRVIPELKRVFQNCIKYLVATERYLGSNGTWTSKSSVAYARYHAAWCGVVGLIPHQTLNKRVAFLGNLADPEPQFL